MNQERENPLETVLLAIAQVAPQPWYYQYEARERDLDVEAIGRILELLYLQGLVQRAAVADTTTGPGVELTALGRQVLEDPELRRKLRENEPLTNDQGAIVRASLLRPLTPYLTRILLAANFAVFAYCLYLGRIPQEVMNSYLSGSPNPKVIAQILHPAGGLSGDDLLRQEWWRMLSAAFVHGGLLHIGMNMYALWAVGRFVEQTWGHVRFLLIYLIGAWGSSCLAMSYAPQVLVVGASGALCAVLAAEGVWIFLNSRHLPRALVQRGKSGFLTTVVLMVFISFMPGISSWGHLGGALAGAAVALGLHYQRFGGLTAKFLGLLLVLATPVVSLAYLQEHRGAGKGWSEVEARQFSVDYLRQIQSTMRESVSVYQEKVKPVRDRHPERRTAEEVQEALAALREQIGALESLERSLKRAGPYRSAEIGKAHEAALAYTEKRREVFVMAAQCLEAGPEWTRVQEREFDRLWGELREKRAAWEALLE